MNKTFALFILLAVVVAFISGCASKDEDVEETDTPTTPVDIATETSDAPQDIAGDAAAGWVDDSEEVEIGDMI